MNVSENNQGLPITAYKLYKDSGSLDSTFTMFSELDATDESFTGLVTIDGLNAGNIYRFTSTAINLIDESDDSFEVLFAAVSLPAKPAPIRRSTDSTRSVLVIEWDVEVDSELPITGYMVEADLTQNNDFVLIWDGRDRPEINKMTVPNTVKSAPYTFRHRAYNFNGHSVYSDEVTTFTCLEPQPPSKPRWITSTETSISLEWDQTVDDGGCPVVDYRIFRDSGQGLGEVDITQEVHADLLEDKTHITSLAVTEFPAGSVG